MRPFCAFSLYGPDQNIPPRATRRLTLNTPNHNHPRRVARKVYRFRRTRLRQPNLGDTAEPLAQGRRILAKLWKPSSELQLNHDLLCGLRRIPPGYPASHLRARSSANIIPLSVARVRSRLPRARPGDCLKSTYNRTRVRCKFALRF